MSSRVHELPPADLPPAAERRPSPSSPPSPQSPRRLSDKPAADAS